MSARTAASDPSTAGSRDALRAWIAVALWTALVWTLSSDPFSAQSTSRFLGPLVRWLWPAVTPDTLAWIHAAVRKSAHLFEYAVLGALTLRALRRGASRRVLHSAGLAFAFAGVVAIADETHQARTPSRTGSPLDVALDGSGAVLGIATFLAVARARARARRDPGLAPARAPAGRADAVPTTGGDR